MSAVASVPAVAVVVAVLTGADVPTVLLLAFIAFDCILAVICVSAVVNIPVLLAVLGIRIRYHVFGPPRSGSINQRYAPNPALDTSLYS